MEKYNGILDMYCIRLYLTTTTCSIIRFPSFMPTTINKKQKEKKNYIKYSTVRQAGDLMPTFEILLFTDNNNNTVLNDKQTFV